VEGKVVRGEGKNRRRVMFRNVEIHYQLLAWCDGGSFRCGVGWRRSFEGSRSKARGQVNGSRGTRPDNGVLCEDGKFDGESLSSPSDGRPTALLYLKVVGGGRRGPQSTWGPEQHQTALGRCLGANRYLLSPFSLLLATVLSMAGRFLVWGDGET